MAGLAQAVALIVLAQTPEVAPVQTSSVAFVALYRAAVKYQEMARGCAVGLQAAERTISQQHREMELLNRVAESAPAKIEEVTPWWVAPVVVGAALVAGVGFGVGAVALLAEPP